MLEGRIATLNMVVAVAGIILGAFLLLGTVGSIFSLFRFEHRTAEAHGLSIKGESASQQRAAEVHEKFLEGSVQTLNLVNATLELAKEASERAASFLENKARETSDALDSEAKAFIADVSQADDRALVEGEKRSSKILSLGAKISGFEINRFVLPQDFKLTPHCLFIRGMAFHLNQQFEDAIEHWGKVALDENADSNLRSRAWYWMGYELNNLGDFTGAVQRFASALELAKGSRAYEIKRIRLESRFFAGEQPAQLIGPLEALLLDIETDKLCDSEELAVRKRKTAVTLGNLYHMQGESYRNKSEQGKMKESYEKAVQYFRMAEKEDKWARSGLAEALFRLEKTEEAIKLFRLVRIDAQAELINRVEKRTKTLARATELLCCVRVPEWNEQIPSMNSQVVEALGNVGERLTVYSQWQRRNVFKAEFKNHLEQFEKETYA
ncbi:MAG: hypothetical protein HY287_18385 [Planctomycetes bacterium]|nr:hypothetical protein [Planctomycetota bacterium]